MPVRYNIVLLVSLPSVLFLSPGSSRAASPQPTENAATTRIDTPTGTSTPNHDEAAGEDLQKKGFLDKVWDGMTDEAHLTVGY
jgi:hypothetical protein